MKKKIVVIALGGNALIGAGQQGTIAEQFENVRKSLDGIIYCLKEDFTVVITHGNGPQVGNLLLMVEACRNQVPELSLGVCVADTEGAIGYMIQQSLENEFHRRGVGKMAVAVVTQVEVEAASPAFKNPTKPIGSFGDLPDRGWEEPRPGYLPLRQPGTWEDLPGHLPWCMAGSRIASGPRDPRSIPSTHR